ncbi:mammalian cell entry protein [Burkholderia sp. WAC0059]|uniref:PqiB family protein n=1 Tax=Burkholderia sp. WAC0059 TaxID=2066022 RepID=UPI000C7EDE64|nr:MlaD family protein [Burkholderia sp. WAC0059]PLY99978.1 mammalian cell entry protein [Burkholderia sp. WAC0059]
MSLLPDKNPHEPHDPPVTRSRWRISPVWLVPLVAALIGLSMVIHTWLSAGPEITLSFQTAAGLEAGKTPVKYKDVTVGTVSSVALSDDGSHVIARVSLARSARSLTRADTRFWVVRPRIGIGGVSGVDTLLSGAYIGVDTGLSKAVRTTFTGLETPPAVINGVPGTSFAIHTGDLGSLDIGSPVYYRRIQVGQVTSYNLDTDGRSVSVQIFVNAPYDHFVTTDSRFWNASGVDLSLGADGLKLKTQSLATIVAGGIAFAAPDSSTAVSAPAGTHFTLATDEHTAMAPPDGPAQYIQLRFMQPLRGLSVGAPVEFSGIDVGRVVSMKLDYDPATQHFPSIVGIQVYPQRLGPVLDKLPKLNGDTDQQAALFLGSMVARGLRAQARSGNLLTGQLYISLDFVPNAPKVSFDLAARPVTLPTVDGSFEQLQEQVASIAGKIDRMPLDSIAQHLDTALAELDSTLGQVNGQVLPATTQTLQQARQTFGAAQGMLADDSPLQQNLAQTLQEIQRTARSLRTLTDLLGRHPEALLRGRTGDALPAASGNHSGTDASQDSNP